MPLSRSISRFLLAIKVAQSNFALPSVQPNPWACSKSSAKCAPYTNSFFEAAILIRSGEKPLQALQPFLAQLWVKRCYLLDELGRQVGQNFLPDSSYAQTDPRFVPLDDASDAIWARRHYYQQALAEPGRVQVSKRYLSITGGALCITLSIAIGTSEGLRVLCGDIATPD